MLVFSSRRIPYVAPCLGREGSSQGHCVKRQNRSRCLGIRPPKGRIYKFKIHPLQPATVSFAEIYVGRTVVPIFPSLGIHSLEILG